METMDKLLVEDAISLQPFAVARSTAPILVNQMTLGDANFQAVASVASQSWPFLIETDDFNPHLPNLQPEGEVGANEDDEVVVIYQGPEYAWHACVLWESNLFKKLEDHKKKWRHERYSTLDIAKKLSRVVIEDNPDMDWEKPFQLFQLHKKGYRREGDNFLIRLATLSTANNVHKGVHERLYDLVLPDCQEHFSLAKEITRLPRKLTIVMIWNAFVDFVGHHLLNIPYTGEQIMGKIILEDPATGCVPAILIFHGEHLELSRMQEIQGVFYNSELAHFDKPGIQRTTRSRRLGEEEGQNRFAVHFSKAYRIRQGPGPQLYLVEDGDGSTEEEEDEHEDTRDIPQLEDVQVPTEAQSSESQSQNLSPAPTEPEPDGRNGSIVTVGKNSDSDSELGRLLSTELEDNISTATLISGSGGDPELTMENASDAGSERRTFSRCIDQLANDILTLKYIKHESSE